LTLLFEITGIKVILEGARLNWLTGRARAGFIDESVAGEDYLGETRLTWAG
jgi:hypothetical protein